VQEKDRQRAQRSKVASLVKKKKPSLSVMDGDGEYGVRL
jgi:hypothetical protein